MHSAPDHLRQTLIVNDYLLLFSLDVKSITKKEIELILEVKQYAIDHISRVYTKANGRWVTTDFQIKNCIDDGYTIVQLQKEEFEKIFVVGVRKSGSEVYFKCNHELNTKRGN